MCFMFITFVMEEHTVKARGHHGTNSLDLTIPTQIAKECGIASGMSSRWSLSTMGTLSSWSTFVFTRESKETASGFR